jgi:hypothetical protein
MQAPMPPDHIGHVLTSMNAAEQGAAVTISEGKSISAL